MRYSPALQDAFTYACNELPNEVRTDVLADRYKYLTDVSLIHGALPSSTARILDIGGARSVNTIMLRRLGFRDLHMVDRFDRTEMELLTKREHPTRSLWEQAGVEAQECDVAREPLPYPNNSFDLVAAVDIIEHFNISSKNFFEEVYRVLTPGGILVTGCPNIANLQNRIKIMFGKSVHSRLEFWHNTSHYIGHIREFTPDEIEQILKRADFEVLHRYMGEEELDSVIKDRAKLQRDRTLDDNKLTLSKPGDLAFYLGVLLYYGVVKVFPGCRYFTRIIARRPN